MYVVYINLLYFLSIFLFTYNKKSSFPKKKSLQIQSVFVNVVVCSVVIGIGIHYQQIQHYEIRSFQTCIEPTANSNCI